ncbi:acyltransferase family protein [Ligilactobacillus agilis]|uniref:acyltransferase family protein n=1 Tax=Ligilactobacillus agilis TaxID=1601 RepID=UPI00067ED542|nr:acyltransferase [Ligilactobacillus agilis]
MQEPIAKTSKNFKKKILSLTSWRFLMILTIVISHFEFFGNGIGTGELVSNVGNFYDYHFHNAGMGVAFFFIMSGFGLTYSAFIKNNMNLFTSKWTFSFGYRYAKKKMNKLWKWYIFTIIIGIPLELYGIFAYHDAIKGLCVFMVRFLVVLSLLQSGTGSTDFSHAFNGVCWFLSTLFILYIIYPILFKINQRIKENIKLIWLGICLVNILYFIFHILFEKVDDSLALFNDFAYGSPYIRVFQFFLGILLCDLFIWVKQSKYMKKISILCGKIELGLLAIFFIWYLEKNDIYYGRFGEIKDFLDMVFVALIIFVYAFECGIISHIFQDNKFVLLGSVSMYVFLIHYPIRMNTWRILSTLFGTGISVKVITLVIVIIGTCVMTILMRTYDNKKKRIIDKKNV